MQPRERQIVEGSLIGCFSPMPRSSTTPHPGVGRPANPAGRGQSTTTSVERTAACSGASACLPAFSKLDDLLQWATRCAWVLWDADDCLVWLRDPSQPDHYLRTGSVDWLRRHDGAMLQALTAIRVPVHAQSAPVGAVEVVGPRGGHLSVEDGERLEAFADDVGAAYEQLLLHERTRRDAMGWRLGILAGVGLMAMGLMLILGAAWGLAARALPLSLLPVRPGVWPGAVLTVVGLLLAGARRRRSRRRPS